MGFTPHPGGCAYCREHTAKAMVSRSHIEPAAEGDRQVKEDVRNHLAEIRAVFDSM